MSQITWDEDELYAAQDRLFEKLGRAVWHDDDLVLLLAAFAADMGVNVGGMDLREHAREWLQS